MAAHSSMGHIVEHGTCTAPATSEPPAEPAAEPTSQPAAEPTAISTTILPAITASITAASAITTPTFRSPEPSKSPATTLHRRRGRRAVSEPW